MANTFLTLQTIAREALPRLMDNLVFPNLIHRDFSADMSAALGDTIRVRKPQIMEATEFNPSTGVTYGDFTETAVEVKLDKIATVDKSAEAIETATNIDDLNRIFIEPAAVALAEKINSDGLMLYKDIPYYCGEAGTTPNSLAAFADARKVLNKNKAPQSQRRGVWDPEADAAFTQIPALVNAEKSGTTQALREGAIGRVFGIDNYMSQAVKVHAGGSAAGELMTSAQAAKGATSIAVDGATAATATVKKGDLITVYGQQFVCTEDVTFSSNAGTIKVYPAVSRTIPNDTAVTVVQNGTQNLVFHPMAFAYVTRPLINPDGQGVASYVTSYNGLSLRVTRGYDQKYKRSMYSMDVLYGYKTIYPELAVRVLG